MSNVGMINNIIDIIGARFIASLGNMPGISKALRKIARRYEDGSIVQIKSGYAAGMLWSRYHKYVNGYWLGIYELPLQERIATELKEGDVFFDIGANAGFFSIVAAKKVGKKGCVVAFDPLPMNARVIEEQFNINQLEQCRCICVALGKEKGIGELILPKTPKGAPSTSTAYLTNKKMKEEVVLDSFNVSISTLDEFVNREGLIPDLIKIDVEGAEGHVLRGGRILLHSNKAPRILVETHGDTVARDVNNQLHKAGYRIFTLNGNLLSDSLTERHYIAYPPSYNQNPFGTK